MSEPNSPDGDAAVLSSLLALRDEAFVRAAYRALLGRDSDETGLAAYTAELRQGESRERILASLAASDEGRQRHPPVAGVERLMARFPVQPAPFWKRAVRGLLRRLGAPSREPLERSLRAIDNQVFRLEQLVLAQDASIHALRQDVARLTSALESQAAGSVRDMPDAPALARSVAAAPPVRQVPPRVDQLLGAMRQHLHH